LTVDCYHFLLVEGVGRHLSLVAKTRLGVTGRLVSGYSPLPPPSPPTLSGIMDHQAARTHTRAVGYQAQMSFDLLCSATRQQVLNLQ